MTNEELLIRIRGTKASGATWLDLRNQRLTTLPSEIGQLTNLIELNLCGNKLTALPPEIGQLRNLQKLNLWGNKLTMLPSELFLLVNLIYLDLRNNQLTALPSELFKLANLTWLDLGLNRLITLPPEIGQLTNLTWLDLGDNRLTTLPLEICQFTKLERLWLDDNPLTTPPPEIVEQGIDAIRRYLVELEKSNRPLNEVKILLVGEGSAGKTSLVKQLLGEVFDKDEDTTHGISIRGWDVEAGGTPIKVNIWDFGGQEIMHATHQFFLSKRSLYVLVLDGRKDERAEYWLRHIESFGEDSPVLVVLNKQDSNPSFDLNRPFLQEKYKGIRNFFRTCCADGRGIDEFKEALIDELGKVPMIGIRWPQSWFQVKQRIEGMQCPYISREKYGDLCAEADLAGDDNRETLVDFLHDLGVAVHFKGLALKAMHILDPVWVTNAVYKIINAEEMTDSKGILHEECLDSILKQCHEDKHCYPAHTHVYLLELMKKFELCYPAGTDAVLIPQLLPVPEPEFTFDSDNALGFVLHYQSFLPPSVFPRFMVKVHQSIKSGLCWRTGAVLYDKESGSEAVVKADTEARRIYLRVNGPHRKEFLSFLWFSLREINSSFEKLAVSERIPMPDAPHITADYQTLLNHLKAGLDNYMPEGAENVYPVKKLLGLVEPEGEDEMRQLMRKIETRLDGKESAAETVNHLIEMKPNFFGMGLNLNELFTRILGKKKQR
jgi:small GTP-binding protein